MDLEYELLREHSRRQAERIAAWVGTDRKRFRRLMALFLNGEMVLSQRSAWVLRICAERDPAAVGPYLARMVKRLQEPGIHDEVKRNVVGILQGVEVPRGLQGSVATACFGFLTGDAPIAVKAFSMTVLDRIAEKEPDLRKELRLVIEQQLPFASAGFRARAKKVLVQKRVVNSMKRRRDSAQEPR